MQSNGSAADDIEAESLDRQNCLITRSKLTDLSNETWSVGAM
jgi:hypothetical protein